MNWLRNIHGGLSGGWFERYGPSITPPAPPVCVIGWAWAEITSLIVHHLAGVRPGLDGLTVRPRLPEGVDTLSGSFRLRGTDWKVSVRRTHGAHAARVNGRSVPLTNDVLLVKYAEAGAGPTVIEMEVA